MSLDNSQRKNLKWSCRLIVLHHYLLVIPKEREFACLSSHWSFGGYRWPILWHPGIMGALPTDGLFLLHHFIYIQIKCFKTPLSRSFRKRRNLPILLKNPKPKTEWHCCCWRENGDLKALLSVFLSSTRLCTKQELLADSAAWRLGGSGSSAQPLVEHSNMS